MMDFDQSFFEGVNEWIDHGTAQWMSDLQVRSNVGDKTVPYRPNKCHSWILGPGGSKRIHIRTYFTPLLQVSRGGGTVQPSPDQPRARSRAVIITVDPLPRWGRLKETVKQSKGVICALKVP